MADEITIWDKKTKTGLTWRDAYAVLDRRLAPEAYSPSPSADPSSPTSSPPTPTSS